MKEYKTVEFPPKICKHNDYLNKYAEEGWKVICTYGLDSRRIILERSKLVTKLGEND